MKHIMTRAQAIKLAIFDVDGVMTDGKLYLDDDGKETKAFYAQDGIGIKMLRRSGISVAIITGRKSQLVARRAKELGIETVYQGIQDKFAVYESLCGKLSLQPAQTAMVGDDVPDLKIMAHCGLAIAVANALPLIKTTAHYTTLRHGGLGAVREACELIMKAQDTLQAMLQVYR